MGITSPNSSGWWNARVSNQGRMRGRRAILPIRHTPPPPTPFVTNKASTGAEPDLGVWPRELRNPGITKTGGRHTEAVLR